SGGGDTYDDEVPPPNASVRVLAPGRDAPTGAAFDEIGEWSRAYHASQGMGHWKAEAPVEWPLHLKIGGSGAETDIRQALPATLADLATRLPDAAASALKSAQARIDAALLAFPDRKAITEALVA